MTHPELPEQLQPLLSYLNALRSRAPVPELESRLQNLRICVDDVQEFVRFSDPCYLRNLVCEGEFYHLLVLCWRSGQRSPIHNHASSTCGMRILTGTATETTFEKTPSSLVKGVSSHDWNAGEISVSQDSFIHQVSNLQAPGQDLITLHIYSPPLLKMDTFSLTEPTVGEYRPMILEHALGSGI